MRYGVDFLAGGGAGAGVAGLGAAGAGAGVAGFGAGADAAGAQYSAPAKFPRPNFPGLKLRPYPFVAVSRIRVDTVVPECNRHRWVVGQVWR